MMRCILKGLYHEIFCFRFFQVSPQAPENNFSVHFKFIQKFTEIFASQGKFATSVNDTGGKLWWQLHRRHITVATTPVLNLQPVSTTPVTKKWEHYQTAY
jgi:hypothetical protein